MGKHFLWDPVEDNIVKEIDDAGATIADYTTEPYPYGDLISQHRDGQSSFYHYDGQGSTTSLTDSAANVTDNYAYSAFGEVTARIRSTVNVFQYIGKSGYFLGDLADESRVRRRILRTHAGNWLSLDPVGLYSPLDLAHITYAYIYARNSPSMAQDPSGLLTILEDSPHFRVFCGDKDRIPSVGIYLTFVLDADAPCEGFMVQKVDYYCRVQTDCSKCPLTSSSPPLKLETYYEAWHVMETKRSPADPVLYTDHPRSEINPGVCGEKMSVGTVKFFCLDKRKDPRPIANKPETKDLRTLWDTNKTTKYGTPPCSVMPGGLPSTRTPPDWWSLPPVEGPAYNYMMASWDCCPDHECPVLANGGKGSPFDSFFNLLLQISSGAPFVL